MQDIAIASFSDTASFLVMSKTGDLLKAHRERLAKSQGDLAAAADLSRGVISETESGDLPKLSTVVRMKDGLGLGRTEWNRLLSTYLVEAGAVDDPEAKTLLSSAVRISKTTSEERSKLLQSIADSSDRKQDDHLAILAGVMEMLDERPEFYPALAALVEMHKSARPSRQPAPDLPRDRRSTRSTTPGPIPKTPREPMDPAMKKLKAAKNRPVLS